jgi:hypothetical protein
MSDKPLTERLQVKNGRTLAVLDAPASLDAALATDRPETPVEAADVVLLFAVDRARFDAALAGVLPRLKAGAILWLAYPKLTSKLAADLSRDIIHAAAPAYGLDTVSQIAVDLDWSALRLRRV